MTNYKIISIKTKNTVQYENIINTPSSNSGNTTNDSSKSIIKFVKTLLQSTGLKLFNNDVHFKYFKGSEDYVCVKEFLPLFKKQHKKFSIPSSTHICILDPSKVFKQGQTYDGVNPLPYISVSFKPQLHSKSIDLAITSFLLKKPDKQNHQYISLQFGDIPIDVLLNTLTKHLKNLKIHFTLTEKANGEYILEKTSQFESDNKSEQLAQVLFSSNGQTITAYKYSYCLTATYKRKSKGFITYDTPLITTFSKATITQKDTRVFSEGPFLYCNNFSIKPSSAITSSNSKESFSRSFKGRIDTILIPFSKENIGNSCCIVC